MKLFKILLVVLSLLCFLTSCGIVVQPPESTDQNQTTTESTAVSEGTTETTTESTTGSEGTTETTAPEESTENTVETTTETPTETTVPSTPQTPGGVTPSTQIISTGDGYQIVREDRSYRNTAGQVLISHYFDYVEVADTFPGAQKINDEFKQITADFFWSEEELAENAVGEWGPDPEYPFFCTRPSEVTYMTDRYLCVVVGMQWYMGGVGNSGSEGYVFDLQTGELLTLADFAEGNPTEMEIQLKQIAWAQISNDPNEEPWEDSYEMLSAYTLDTFNFAIDDGQIVLFFSEYEFFSGAHGPVTVYTGLYI